ncbi:uncharacterized protein [Montipora capricornis]|uniref:uncharacterized protein n=1 Tax=Montipora capricornis TaxID=246305 RepID=UPI0035F11677
MLHNNLFLLSSFLLVFGLVRALDCGSNSQDPAYEPFPKNVTPPQFHTRMEVTLSHRNETYFVNEMFDAEKERGAFTLLANGYDWESHWDKSENEIDYVYLDQCRSYNWTQQGFDRYRCRFPPNESSLKLIGDACSATVVLDLVYKNQTKNARYLGQKIVRNIPVKGWRLCKEDTAMDYWFTVQGWTHTSGNTSVPVVVEARPQNASNLTGGIIHSYSFIDFYFVDPEFRVQREMWCWGAVHAPPLPKLPRRFDVNLEYLYADSGRIWASREYYDLDKHHYRVDYDRHSSATKEAGSRSRILDFKTNSSTIYDRQTGSCKDQGNITTKPMLLEKDDFYMIYVPFGKLTLFEDPDATPFYQGRASTRGIKCDVWQQIRINWPEKTMEKTIWRWYFTRVNWTQNLEVQPVPVKLTIEGNITINATAKIEYELNLNFYSFESRYPAKSAFDLSTLCNKKPAPIPEKSSLSSGAVTGVAIACIVVGLLLGALVVYVVFRRVVLARMGPPPQKFP